MIPSDPKSYIYLFCLKIDPPLIVNLKSPISVNPGELITITAEGANYIIIEPWRRTNVTIHQLIGIQLYKSCEESRVCFETLNVNPVQDNCTISNFKKFLLDGYQHCLGTILPFLLIEYLGGFKLSHLDNGFKRYLVHLMKVQLKPRRITV